MDLDYAVGSSVDCGNILCCRADHAAKDESDKAGAYGEIAACDIPPSVMDKMGEKINELAPDVLLWTGDVPPHDQWNYTMESEKRYQDYLFEFMTNNLNQWSTYPLEGNHDFAEVINS